MTHRYILSARALPLSPSAISRRGHPEPVVRFDVGFEFARLLLGWTRDLAMDIREALH